MGVGWVVITRLSGFSRDFLDLVLAGSDASGERADHGADHAELAEGRSEKRLLVNFFHNF